MLPKTGDNDFVKTILLQIVMKIQNLFPSEIGDAANRKILNLNNTYSFYSCYVISYSKILITLNNTSQGNIEETKPIILIHITLT